MKNLLKDFKKQKKMVSIYYDKYDPDREYTGYVTDIRGKYILLARITDDGLANGYILKHPYPLMLIMIKTNIRLLALPHGKMA